MGADMASDSSLHTAPPSGLKDAAPVRAAVAEAASDHCMSAKLSASTSIKWKAVFLPAAKRRRISHGVRRRTIANERPGTSARLVQSCEPGGARIDLPSSLSKLLSTLP